MTVIVLKEDFGLFFLSGTYPCEYPILKYQNTHAVTWGQLVKKLLSAMPWIILGIALIGFWFIILLFLPFNSGHTYLGQWLINYFEF